MREIIVSAEQFKNDYPEVFNQMIKELKFSKEEYTMEETQFYYCWNILPIFEDAEEMIDIEIIKHTLTFEERVFHESSKLGVEIYIHFDDYIRGYILDEDEVISDIILEDLENFIVSTMRYEQNFFLDKKVIDSIPNDLHIYTEIDYLLSPTLLNDNIKECDNLDDILDKINKYGIDSLSESEKNILNDISKN